MSSSTNEIITLQFGHYANFVGTHFWNIQTSTLSLSNLKYDQQKNLKSNDTNYDAIFREGKTLTNESTYTPRVIFHDLKNSLNTLKSDGTLYDFKKSSANVSSTWLADINLHEVSTVHKNDFLNSLENDKNSDSNKIEPHHCQKYPDEEEREINSKRSYLPSSSQNIFRKRRFKLDNEVSVWSDFLRPHLHPKSIEIIDSVFHDNAEAFNLFSLGSEAYNKQKYDVEDKIHFFTEECDNLQGFHILADTYNAFSGFSVSVFEDYLLDEFPNKGFLVVNTFPRHAKKDFTTSVKSLINTFLSYESFLTSASVLPLSTENSLLHANSSSSSSVAYEHLNYNPNLSYHTSALLAVGLDQLSLKYRSHRNSICLKDYLSGLTFNTHKLLSLSLSLPFSIENNTSLFRMFNPDIGKKHDSDVNFSSVFRSLSPGMCKNYKVSAQHAVFSGLTDQIVYGSNVDVSKLTRYANKFELLNEYLIRSFNYNSSTVETFKNAMIIDEPFPHIFSPSLIHGKLLGPENVDDDGYVNSVPVASVLQNNSAVGGHLDEILSAVEKVPRHNLRNFIGSCMELDDFNAKLENLQRFRQNYSDSDMFS